MARSFGRTLVVRLAALALVVAACTGDGTADPSPGGPPVTPSQSISSASNGPEPEGIGKIDHFIFIVQENRSFDHYFGTFPGADGLPTNANGEFTTCVPDPVLGHCAKPYHDDTLIDLGGPHSH